MRCKMKLVLLAGLIVSVLHTIALATGMSSVNEEHRLYNSLQTDMQRVVDERFADGMISYYDGDYHSSLRYFNKIQPLIKDVELKFWVALCKFRLGDTQGAKYDLASIQSANPNHEPTQLMLAMLNSPHGVERSSASAEDTLVDESQRKERQQLGQKPKVKKDRRWYHYLSLDQEIRWDNNINAGSDKSEIVAPNGNRYFLDDSEQVIEDWGTTTFLYGFLRFDPKIQRPLLWDTRASLFHTHYFDHDEYDRTTFRLNSGPTWKTKRILIHLPVGYRLYNEEYGLDFDEFSINPYVQYKFNHMWAVRGSFSYRDRSYGDDVIDGYNRLIRHFKLTPLVYLNNKRTLLALTLGIFDARAEDSRFNYCGARIGMTARQKISTKCSVSIKYRYRFKKYDKFYAGWEEEREDIKNGVYLSVAYQLNKYLALNALTGWSDNHSNIELFDYDRLTCGLSLALTLY